MQHRMALPGLSSADDSGQVRSVVNVIQTMETGLNHRAKVTDILS